MADAVEDAVRAAFLVCPQLSEAYVSANVSVVRFKIRHRIRERSDGSREHMYDTSFATWKACTEAARACVARIGHGVAFDVVSYRCTSPSWRTITATR